MRFLLLCFGLGLLHACRPATGTNPEYFRDADTSFLDFSFLDTLKQQEGQLPPTWARTDLGEGYYIGFPKEARLKQSATLSEYKFKKNEYELYVSVRDLSKEPSFDEYREQRTAYYLALAHDLADGLEIDGIQAELRSHESFYALNVFEGMQVEVIAPDVQLHARYVIIGTRLYTLAFFGWKPPIKPELLRLRTSFFNSFGRELQ